MKTRINTFLYIILAVVLMSSCKKDSLFKGTDKAINIFELKQGDVVLKGSISVNSITITAPENLLLKGAVPNVILSEKARIQPDPASISNWDEPHEFVVTAHDGTETTYSYKVERNVISRDGDVVLVSQSDVDALAALKLTAINGSLTIGKANGADQITSIASLSGLKSIAYDLTINPGYVGKDLAGLQNLETVGAIQIGALKDLETIAFPKLKSVALNLIVNGAGVKTLSFPELVKVDRGLQLISLLAMTEMSFPKLKTILQNLTIQGSYESSELKAVNFPELESMDGDLSIMQYDKLRSVKFPKLLKANMLTITGFSDLTSIEMPKLKNLLGNTDLSYNGNLSTLDLSALQTIGGGFRLQNLVALEQLEGLKSLTTVDGELFLYSLSALKNLNGLKALQTVGGNVMLSGFDVLADPNLTGLSGVKKIGGDLIISQVPFKTFSGFALTEINNLSIFGFVSTITDIDVSKINITNTLTISNITNGVKVKGKDVYACGLTIEQSAVELEGFKEVKNLTYNVSSGVKPVQSISVHKVTNNLNIGVYGFTKLSMPNLEEIGKESRITVSSKMELDFPALKKSGSLEIAATQMDVFAMPALQMVEGDCSITTGNYQGSMGDVQFPALTKISGSLKLFGYSSYYTNNRITNLNGFSALTNVKRVELSYNVALVDFKGLKNAIPSLTSANWLVTGNKYNPSYEDMVNAKYVK